MPNLTVIARIKARTDKTDLVREELLKLIEPTRREQGCINYDLHVSNEDPSLFFFHENWADDAALDAHLQTPHIQHILQVTEGALEGLEIHRLKRIG